MISLSHAALYTSDLEATREFFERYFGAVSNSKYTNTTKGFASYFLTFEGGSRLEIMSRSDIDGANRVTGFGLDHLAFCVNGSDEVDSLSARMTADGWPLLSAARTTGDGYYESCIAGPDGVKIEITA